MLNERESDTREADVRFESDADAIHARELTVDTIYCRDYRFCFFPLVISNRNSLFLQSIHFV